MSTRKKVVHMVKKYYANPTSITLEDWDKFIKRNFGKLQAQCKKKFPREEWPPGIPYLNFFAYAKHTEMHNPRSEWLMMFPTEISRRARSSILERSGPRSSHTWTSRLVMGTMSDIIHERSGRPQSRTWTSRLLRSTRSSFREPIGPQRYRI
jgi:hypothetical protein